MKVCVIKPPAVPSYVNAGHNLPLFLVASYLRNKCGHKVTAVDGSVLSRTWKEICDLLTKEKFDLVAIHNDFDAVDGMNRLVRYTRVLSPKSKIITFGRLSHQASHVFRQIDLDAVVNSGDYELGVSQYVEYIENGKIAYGCDVRDSQGEWKSHSFRGFLSPTDWVLPDVKEIPYDDYSNLYKNDLNKFCGIPQRRELVVPAARGCPVGCAFCDVHVQQGLRERRLSVDDTISYIINSYSEINFEYTSFYVPTFTLNKKWVLEFCEKIRKKLPILKWKCVTTIFHLNEELIEQMAKAGCIRISIGVETLSKIGEKSLPKIKQQAEEKLSLMAHYMKKNGIELNCFVILGLPKDNPRDCEYTIKFIESLGGRVRPTIYTPYHLLNNNSDFSELNNYNRQTFVDNVTSKENEVEYYKLFYDYPYKTTDVFNNIPRR